MIKTKVIRKLVPQQTSAFMAVVPPKLHTGYFLNPFLSLINKTHAKFKHLKMK